MGDLEVHDLRLDDHDAALDLRHRSFGPMSPGSLAWWDPLFEKGVASGRALGVVHDGVVVATARAHEYQQLWGGQPLPMAGVAGVVVAPEWRGKGVATVLMTALMARAVELGDVLSVLFPAALPPYRKLGYELAGVVRRTTFRAAALRGLGAPTVAVRRATGQDTEEIVDLLRREASRSYDCGPLQLTLHDVRELVTDEDNFCYLADDGLLVYAWDGDDLRVERVVAASPATVRSLWALVGSGSSWVPNVYTYQPSHDPIHRILDEMASHELRDEWWMLRLLDAPAAVAGRGFPAGLTVDVPLRLDDSRLAGCVGSFRLQISEGSGSLVAEQHDSSAAVRLGPNGLAALYAGTPVATLRNSGLLTGGTPVDHALLDAAFTARPYLIDSF